MRHASGLPVRRQKWPVASTFLAEPDARLGPASLQLSLVLAAPAFLAGAAQGFGERSAAGGLLRLARRRGRHRRAGIVPRHALPRPFPPGPRFLIHTPPLPPPLPA